ncbi:hypothetical protein GCM10022419_133640 [Nonomuraea rosea]|uniref:Uncharacterized protein n=1 Tax=Nonomuraea rosea TaxID=638574 RepID=A0ABP7A5N5_9ACTN
MYSFRRLAVAGFFGKWTAGAWEYGPRLDYSVPGLVPVGDAAKAGDYTLAKQRLLEYCRSRPAIEAGGFTHTTWPGALELTPSYIWTLGTGEVYVKTVAVGPGTTTVTADVTGTITSGKSGFFLMSRYKDAIIASVNSGHRQVAHGGERPRRADRHGRHRAHRRHRPDGQRGYD